MALNIYNNFNFLFRQVGYYIEAVDRSNWSSLTGNRTDYGFAMVYASYDSVAATDGAYVITAFEDQLRFLGSVNQEYIVRMYAALKFIDGTTTSVAGTIYWYQNYLWLAVNPVSTAPTLGPDWTLIDASNLDPLIDNNNIAYKMNGYSLLVYSPATSNFITTKTGDHAYAVEWVGEGTATEYEVMNYKYVVLEQGTVFNNKISFTTEQDGVYVVSFLVDGTKHYTEVYDFTDSEKCYLELMRNILCECVDCDDCPNSNYNRALNFSNLYLLVRDIVYANSAVSLGLIDTKILRVEYVSALGLVMQKLMIMTDSCLCSKNNNND